MKITVIQPGYNHRTTHNGDNLTTEQHFNYAGDEALQILDGTREIAYYQAGHWAAYEIHGTPNTDDQPPTTGTTSTTSNHNSNATTSDTITFPIGYRHPRPVTYGNPTTHTYPA